MSIRMTFFKRLSFITKRPLEGLAIDRTVRIGGVDHIELGTNVFITGIAIFLRKVGS